MNEFRDRILTYRAKYGLTQQEFADKCGLSRQTVVTLERNEQHYVNMKTKHKLEKVLAEAEE